MKKFIFAFLFVFCFLVVGEKASASYTYVKVESNASLYDVVNGDIINVGTVYSGNTYTLVNEDDKYYYIKYGNAKAYFSKTAGIVTTSSPHTNVNNATYANSNTVVITQRPVTVFQNVGDAGGYATISRNMRYPIVDRQGDYYRVDVGNRLGYISASSTFVVEDKGIAVFMYHHMVENHATTRWSNNAMVIDVAEFQKQMDYLKANGYRTINLRDLDNYLSKRLNLTGRVAVITFDDGYLSTDKYAVPIFRANGQQATNFAIGARIKGQAEPWDIETLQYMGLKEMDANGDVLDHQHHTMNMHLRDATTDIPYLISKSYDEIVADLKQGQIQIDKSTAVDNPYDVKYLAYPWGQYDSETVSASIDAGIRMAFTTERDNVRLGMGKMALPRQGIGYYHTLDDFIAKLNGTYTE